jgi:signal transduction histidine kinase
VRLGSLIRGEPFRAALRMVVVFAVMYAAAAYILLVSVENTLRADLAHLAEVESELLREIYARQGQAGLERAIARMAQGGQVAERAYGLFNAQSLKLAGDIPSRPEFLGIGRRPVEVVRAGAINGRYVVFVERVDALTLVVGRDDTFVRHAVQRLSIGAASFGSVLIFSLLLLGLWASRTAQTRLDRMDAGLQAFAQGQIKTRLPVSGRSDQIDRVSERMNANLGRLERLMGGMKSTASSIAHDLKTPLSHAQIAMHDAARAQAEGQDPTAKIEKALEETDRLNTLFETVLRISRIQSSELSRETVNLSKVAEKVAEFLAPLAEEYGKSISVTATPQKVSGDRGMIEQALVNLVQNACVHSENGTKIEIVVGTHDEAKSIEVRDQGPGIAPDALEKVRAPFHREEVARSSPGHGLGLSLAQAVADAHDAKLLLENTNPGFVARLRFPNFKKF